jgi:hypothetical protein
MLNQLQPTTPAATGLSSTGTLLRVSWRVYTRAYDGIFLILLLVQLPLDFAAELVDRGVRGARGAVPYTVGDLLASWKLQQLLQGTVGILAVMAVIHLVAQAVLGRRITPWAGLRAAARHWGRGFLASFLAGLGEGLGFFLLVVPGVILSVRWAFVLPVVILGETGGRSAMNESARLVSGRWWPVCGRLVALFILPILAWGVLAIITVLMTPKCLLQDVSLGFLFSVCLAYSWVGTTLLYLDLLETASAERIDPGETT